MKNLIFILFLLISGCAQTQSNKKTVAYFKDNYSYDWDRVKKSDIQNSLIQECKSDYHKNGLYGDTADDMRLKRIYRTEYNSKMYLILEFDFLDVFDARIDYVIDEKQMKIIGYFERSLA